jgi:hypothetical protein
VVILQGQRKPNDQDKEINGISNKIIKILKVPLKRNGELFKIYVICGPPHSTELLPNSGSISLVLPTSPRSIVLFWQPHRKYERKLEGRSLKTEGVDDISMSRQIAEEN